MIFLTVIYFVVLVVGAVSLSLLMYNKSKTSEIATMNELAEAKVSVGDWNQEESEEYIKDTTNKINKQLPLKYSMLGVLIIAVMALVWLIPVGVFENEETATKAITEYEIGTYIPVDIINDGEEIKFTSTQKENVIIPIEDVIFAATEYDNGCYVVIRDNEDISADDADEQKQDNREYIVYIPKGKALTSNGLINSNEIDPTNEDLIKLEKTN